jgi:small subunit ribosomal protein S19
MTRSIWKGPFLDALFLKPNFLNNLTGQKSITKIWSRSSTIPAFLVGQTVLVHNGKEFKTLVITREKVGFKFGTFVLTRTFTNKYKNLKAKKKKK